MYQLELSIKLFRFLTDIVQEVLKGHFMLVQFVVLIVAINHDGGVLVQFRFLSCIGLNTRDRNII